MSNMKSGYFTFNVGDPVEVGKRMTDKVIQARPKKRKYVSINVIKSFYDSLQKKLSKQDKTHQILILGISGDGMFKTIKTFEANNIDYGDQYQGEQALDNYDPKLQQFKYIEYVIRTIE